MRACASWWLLGGVLLPLVVMSSGCVHSQSQLPKEYAGAMLVLVDADSRMCSSILGELSPEMASKRSGLLVLGRVHDVADGLHPAIFLGRVANGHAVLSDRTVDVTFKLRPDGAFVLYYPDDADVFEFRLAQGESSTEPLLLAPGMYCLEAFMR